MMLRLLGAKSFSTTWKPSLRALGAERINALMP